MNYYIIPEDKIPENPESKRYRSGVPGKGLLINQSYEAVERYRKRLISQAIKVDLDKAFGEFIRDYVMEMGEVATGKIICKTKDGKSFTDYLKKQEVSNDRP